MFTSIKDICLLNFARIPFKLYILNYATFIDFKVKDTGHIVNLHKTKEVKINGIMY